MTVNEQLGAAEGTLNAEQSAYRVAAIREIRAALEAVAETIHEVRSEVGDQLRGAGAKDFLKTAMEKLAPLEANNELVGLVQTAMKGLEAACAWCEGERDLNFFDAIVDVVAFALQVQQYCDRGHFLGDLKDAGVKLLPAIQHLMPLIETESEEAKP